MKAKAYNLVNSVVQEEMDAGLLAEIFAVEAKEGDPIGPRCGAGCMDAVN